jgi:hypothetical protein
MAKLPETPTSEKVLTLYTELRSAKNDKKETVKAHNENIKRIQDELDGLLDDEEDGVKASQKSVDE